MTQHVILALLLGASIRPGLAQTPIACAGQLVPLKPVGVLSCSNTVPVCLTDANGVRGHWVWMCQTSPAPATSAPFGLDPTIPLKVKPAQIDSPVDGAIRAQELRQLQLQNELALERLRASQIQNQHAAQQARVEDPSVQPNFDPVPEPDGRWWLKASEFDRAMFLWSTNKPKAKQKRQQQAVDRYYADPQNLSVRVWDAVAKANWKGK